MTDITKVPQLRVLSLGWGVQSTTLAFMSALGEIEPVDFAIHADTTHESSLTYAYAERWMPWLAELGVRVITASNPKRTSGVKTGKTDLPAFTNNVQGSNGQLRRQCTSTWKILPMRQAIRQYLKDTGIKNPKPGAVEQWIGISLDEFQRMKDSDVKYIVNRWPLIEHKMTRNDCVKWLRDHGLEVPPKSACTFCPFHSTSEWRRIKSNPDDWSEAVEVDHAIRKARPPYDLFVHPARIPLEDVDLRNDQDRGQLSLWDDECSGICGV